MRLFTAAWHATSVNHKKVGNKDHSEDEMYLTNVTAYEISKHDTSHFVLYLCAVYSAH